MHYWIQQPGEAEQLFQWPVSSHCLTIINGAGTALPGNFVEKDRKMGRGWLKKDTGSMICFITLGHYGRFLWCLNDPMERKKSIQEKRGRIAEKRSLRRQEKKQVSCEEALLWSSLVTGGRHSLGHQFWEVRRCGGSLWIPFWWPLGFVCSIVGRKVIRLSEQR